MLSSSLTQKAIQKVRLEGWLDQTDLKATVLKATVLKAILICVFAFGGFACNKKADERAPATRVARGAEVAPVPGPGQSFQPGGESRTYLASTGRIFVQSQYQSEFTQAMKALVSATMDPDQLGAVSIDQVYLRAFVKIDSSGAVIASASRVELEIRDEFTGRRDDEGALIPAVIIRVQAINGFARNGEATVVFGDSYGNLQFSGRFDNPNQTNLNSATFRGEFKFQNSNGRSGAGLAFEIATCGFFEC